MTRPEKIALILTTSGQGDQSARRTYLDGLTDLQIDGMVNQIQLRAAEVSTAQARTDLEIVRAGLRNIDSNFSKIKTKLGDFFSVQSFRAAIEMDPAFKNSLLWDAEPFAAAKKEEQADVQQEQQRRRQFSATVKALTSQGIRNVADNDSNYRVAMDQLDDVLVSGSATNLGEAIALGLIEGLAPNDAETVADLDQANRTALLQSVAARLTHSQFGSTVRKQILTGPMSYGELRERVTLCSELANSHSPDQLTNNNHFCSLFVSVQPNQVYAAQVEQTRERKRLRSLSPSELKAETNRVRTFESAVHRAEEQLTPEGFKVLRPETTYKGQPINVKTLGKLPSEEIKTLLRLYGPQINQRIQEEAKRF
jgi:hypothetical protein